jgi:DNA-binding transcriptional ArsR family regulator
MSPNTNTDSSWDPACLRLDPGASRRLQGGNRRGRRVSPIRGKFIAGPIDAPWVRQAGHLGVKALLVGLTLWYIRGLRKTDTFVVSNLMLQDWGVQPDAKRRALRKLEKAGLIQVERRGKRSPQVTLVVEKKRLSGESIDSFSPPCVDSLRAFWRAACALESRGFACKARGMSRDQVLAPLIAAQAAQLRLPSLFWRACLPRRPRAMVANLSRLSSCARDRACKSCGAQRWRATLPPSHECSRARRPCQALPMRHVSSGTVATCKFH